MYNTFEIGLVKSGNYVQLEIPILMKEDREVVTNEADAFGQAVTIRHTPPENFLVTDKTGSNTREMGDRNNGGRQCMAPCGETPRYEASRRDSHFTIVSFTRMTGELVLVAIIFSGAKKKPEWAMGNDVFTECEGNDDDYLSNVGPGKYFPMGSTCMVDENEIR